MKNPQFLPNQADIQAILPTHELVIFTKFHNNWNEIVDFLHTISKSCSYQAMAY